MAKGCTIYFEFDLASMSKNPLMADTPFGKPAIIAAGNIFEERDDLEEKCEYLLAILAEDAEAVTP